MRTKYPQKSNLMKSKGKKKTQSLFPPFETYIIVSKINYNNFNSNISFVTRQYPRCVDFSAHSGATCNPFKGGGQKKPFISSESSNVNSNVQLVRLKNRLIILALWLPSSIAVPSRAIFRSSKLRLFVSGTIPSRAAVLV